MIPLVDPDLSQEETVFSIIQSTLKFSQIASDVFDRLDGRLAGLQKEFQRAEGRYENVKRKIDALKQMETAVVLRAPSQFPHKEYVPGERILPAVPGVSAPFSEQEVFKPRTPASSFDLKSELEQRKQFFAPSQLMVNGKVQKPVRKIPKDVVSVADLFFEDSDQIAFDGVGGSFLAQSSKSKSVTSKLDKKKSGDSLDRTAIGGRRKLDEDDLFAFRPSTADAPELDLPDFLPDLPGIAVDVILTDLPPVLASALPDIEDKPPLLEIAPSDNNSPSPAPIGDFIPPPPLLPPASSSVPEFRPPPPPVVSSPALATPSPPVFAPPPPPPPPPSLGTPVLSPRDVDSGGRADLMAAIRSAGGAGNMKLKSAKNPPTNTRKEKEKQSLRESSALPSSSGGGDLMSSLAKALETRRKAMNGGGSKSDKPRNSEKAGRLSGAMGRISDMIPPPPEEDPGKRSDSGDEDWS